jgi:hypothetical protein
LVAFPSKVISHVFAVSPRLCGEKFELKVDEVRFVGHPVSLEVAPEEEKYIYRKKATQPPHSATPFLSAITYFSH